jgi:hypothetical protein
MSCQKELFAQESKIIYKNIQKLFYFGIYSLCFLRVDDSDDRLQAV